MEIRKRDGSMQIYDGNKIKNAIRNAYASVNKNDVELLLNQMMKQIESKLYNDINVESIQDIVERTLMENGAYEEAKAYILYREKQAQERQIISNFKDLISDAGLIEIMRQIQKQYPQQEYHLSQLLLKFKSFYKEQMKNEEINAMLVKASVELISKEAPKWEFIASKFFVYLLHVEVDEKMKELNITSFSQKIKYLEEQGYYGAYIRERYSDQDIEELSAYMKESRNDLLPYSGLELLSKRYLIRSGNHQLLEKPQELFMGISMHLALVEEDAVFWAKEIYDLLSTLKVTMATPTMANARKPYYQLSSCFIDLVDDSLSGIYKSIDNFAQVSKLGGGMGLYFGKVRASGSTIRGFEGAAGGVIRWIKLVNDTAIAVDQLGVRQGAVAVYLDVWHKDVPEFLSLRTNNGDDRMKAHDVFPALCYPDLFWKQCKENLDSPWYLMCPHEIKQKKGYALEDFYGEEWEKRYYECVNDSNISKRVIKLKDLVRLILKSAVETGTPFTFNRDHVNRMNPNQHQGMIYCSNLCTEIAQNMKAIELLPSTIMEVDGETIVVEKSKPGDFVVCNLASLSLGNINVTDDNELKHIIEVTIRALDNVIDLNYYPLPYAEITNQRNRPIGLGTSGYHHMLVKQGISFESEAHLKFVDELYEKIAYYAISASNQLAKEKGIYQNFKGSDWESGQYFEKRNYSSEAWKKLKLEVKEHGMRNAYLMAIAPTSSTSIISGTTASVDPIMNKYFLEEKKGSMIARVAPDLNPTTFWLYKNAHLIDQEWIVKAAGIRQRHIDQAQSLNLYITNEFTLRQVLNLYILAWEQNVKTVYYVRSKSLEVEECESCSA